MPEHQKQRLVVIGSGWVGFYIAQYIDTSLYDTTIISPHESSSYTPLLASAACGLFPFTCAEESIRLNRPDVRFLRAYAVDVNFDSRAVKCKSAFNGHDGKPTGQFEVEYDKLVISPGC
jgi:NADH:ubiquinone reductase (non-electrogenic)